MNLRERLAERRAQGEAKRKPEWVRSMHQATDDLRRSGIAARVPKPGSPAPEFALFNGRGEERRLRDWLDRGPLVVSFYRGVW
ncbi:MAG TPA: hypothetical protein VNJ52_05450 [Patescibacteria group bacterium]|nr:hypothetical protein [Patescibacteria group bacterium]